MKINFAQKDYESQVIQNTKDIEKLKADYQPVYSYNGLIGSTTIHTVNRSSTNVPAGVNIGWLMDYTGKLFKITDGSSTTLLIDYYAQIKGPKGDTGDTGPQGPQGPQGIQGPQGEPGQATIGIEVVAELPATGTEGVLYFVPKEDSETGDEYNEYAYVDGEWELLGGAKVDLTNYALKSEIPTIDEDIIPKAFNTYVLGDNTHSYKEVVANKFKGPNSYYEIDGANISGHGQVTIKTTDGNGTNEARIQLGNTALYSNKTIAPMSGSTVNLGQANNGFNNLYLDGKIVTDDNLTYGFTLPDTTNYTADKTIATTSDLPNYNITNMVTDNSEVLGMQIYNTSAGISYNFYNVNPNPTLAGTESDLTSVDIGGTAYKIPTFSGNYNDLTNKPDLSIYAQTANLGTAAAADTGTSSGDVPVLDSNGKLSTSVLPAIAVTDTFVVASEAAMLALTAQVGDIAVRTDLNKSFILQTDGASTLSHWQELLTPTDSVTSVNGQTGAVTLTIPTNSDYVDLTSNQTIDGIKGFLKSYATVSRDIDDPKIGFKGYYGDVMVLSADPTTSNKFTFSSNGVLYSLQTPDLRSFTSTKTIATTDQIPTKTSALTNDSGFITSAPVTSVNGHTGSVTVTQSDLNIVYSATQPSNPVNGTIWIKPTN